MLYVGARRSLLKRRGNSPPIWTPAANFPLGTEPGLWYDPSSFMGLYQDSAGTSPATAVGQPNGLMLDKRLGLVLGSEKAANGDFGDGTTTGWVPNGTGTVASVAGRLRVTSTTSYGTAYYTIPVTTGKWHKVEFAAFSGTGPAKIRLGSYASAQDYFVVGGNSIGPVYVFSTSASLSVSLEVNSGVAGQYAELDNISVRELPGNHISQATASARPIINNT